MPAGQAGSTINIQCSSEVNANGAIKNVIYFYLYSFNLNIEY